MFSRRGDPRHNRGRIPSGGGLVATSISDSNLAEGDTETLTADDWVNPTQFYDNGVLVGTDVTGAGVTTAALPPGTHLFQRALNGGAKDSGVSVVVPAEAPTLALPADGADYVAGDTVTFRATGDNPLFDGSTTTKIEFYVGGTLRATCNNDTAGNWDATWDTTGVSAFSGAAVAAIRYYIDASGATQTIVSTESVSIDLTTGYHLTVDLLFASATWTSPATFWDPAGVASQADVECFGAGGGGTTNTGGGGGGAYSKSTLALSPSTGYAVVVGTSAANTAGGDTTFATTSVVAKGGASGATGTGGAAGSGTGTTKFSGGNGALGTGNQVGGGSAGNAASGSGANPGAADGGYGQANLEGHFPGGGGGSGTSTQRTGIAGCCRVSYRVAPTAGYPRVTGRSWGRDVANGTTRNITLPPGTGGRLILLVASDGIPTISATGWTALTQQNEGTNLVSLACLHIVSSGSEGVALDTSASEMVSWVCIRVLSSSGGTPGAPEWTTTQGSAADPNPPSHTPSGGSAAYLWIAAMGMDSSNLATPTAIPSGYTNGIVVGAFNNGGAELITCSRLATGASEDPGIFSVTTEQFAVGTISVPPT